MIPGRASLLHLQLGDQHRWGDSTDRDRTTFGEAKTLVDSLPKAVRALVLCEGIVEQASEKELADESALADRTGMFACPHTGVVLACLRKLVERGTIGRRDRAVAVSTAHGLKFTEFKTRYHERKLEFEPCARQRPVPDGARPQSGRCRAAPHSRSSSLNSPGGSLFTRQSVA